MKTPSWTPQKNPGERLVVFLVLSWVFLYLMSSMSFIEEKNKFVAETLTVVKWALVTAGTAIIAYLAWCAIKKARKQKSGQETNITHFNDLFVEANKTLTRGNIEALKDGLALLIKSLPVSNPYTIDLIKAIRHLHSALSHYDRADTKGPWNWDLSGYGLHSWQNDLVDRDAALRLAWPHIEKINNSLLSDGLGWNYRGNN